IENHPEWLAQVHGVSRKRALEVGEDFRAKAGMRSAMMLFREPFGAEATIRMYRRWGTAAVEVARRNPYVLCDEIEGIGFDRVDAFAATIGFSKDSPERLRGGVCHVLKHNVVQNGHTCLPKDKLTMASAEVLGVDGELIEEAISALFRLGKLVYVKNGDETYIFDKYTYECEKYIAEKLTLIDKSCICADISEIDRFIEREEQTNRLTYAGLQRQAIVDAMSSGVMILTGGPGTGKTTVVRALLRIFNSMGLKVALASPTGRAAKRLSETTQSEAKTIHRMLEFSYEKTEESVFLRNEHNFLDENVVIIDEMSMTDTYLFCALLKAIKPGAHLILIGDADQLPSVGAGNVLHDIIDSGLFSTIKLTEVFRQAQESLIITNAHRIHGGDMPILDVGDNDFFFLPRESDSAIAATVADLCRNRLPRAYGADIVSRIQVITPSHRGEGGTDNLNRMLQASLNPRAEDKAEHGFRERIFRVGDKVMQVRNNYEVEWVRGAQKGMGIFNGDVGEILSISPADKRMEIRFDERLVSYDFSMLEELELAYAITVHKSQGSEYPVVVITIYQAAPMILTRILIYTAVTRAQRMVILVGRRDVVSTMVANDKQALRYTGLGLHLSGGKRAR
ncbi:MAG: AAA family ATPase, partial [Clostridia bacterium]|nr:AAA family ATPase [Clostridia bacterium]